MAEKEEQAPRLIVSAGVSHHHHHHHHHHSGKKDETGEFRKKMRNHVQRVRLIRKWSFNVGLVFAFLVFCVLIYAYVIDRS